MASNAQFWNIPSTNYFNPTKCFNRLKWTFFNRFYNPKTQVHAQTKLPPLTRLLSLIAQQTLFFGLISQTFQNTKKINTCFKYPFQSCITYLKTRYQSFVNIVRNRAVCLRIRPNQATFAKQVYLKLISKIQKFPQYGILMPK